MIYLIRLMMVIELLLNMLYYKNLASDYILSIISVAEPELNIKGGKNIF